MNREQRLDSGRSWIAGYEGSKIVRDYRRRYGLSWDVAFTELEMLEVQIDATYKSSVLAGAEREAARKRQTRNRRRAEEAAVWLPNSEEEIDPEMWGECAGCDQVRPLYDLGLCEICGQKLERDLIRQRAWDYSAVAFALSEEDYEPYRQQIIADYGEALELIAR